MANELWLKRWEEKNIGWHEEDVNPFLVKNLHFLSLNKNSTVFIPLCGKTLDITWLLSKEINIVGCELSSLAIDELFHELDLEPQISSTDNFKVYKAKGITIFQGDIFHLTKELVGKIDAIYDRAALVALVKEIRGQYTKLLKEISNNAPQLLISVVYDQSLYHKTPYSIPQNEIEEHYSKDYNIKLIESVEVEGGLKGVCEAVDEVWLLS